MTESCTCEPTYTLETTYRQPRTSSRTNVTAAAVRLVERLAVDVGRLRRRSEQDWLINRIAETVETLDVMLSPTAAELYRRRLAEGVADQAALDGALRDVETRATRMRGLLA